MALYAHQSQGIDGIRDAFRRHKSVLYQGACGIGKTHMLTEMVRLAIERGRRVIFGVHRKELLFQTSGTFDSYGLPYSYIAAGRQNSETAAYIASIPTLRNRLGLFPADMLIVDEAHLSMSDGWQKVINHYRAAGAWILGCTASPQRLDGRGLGNNFETMVRGPTVRWLMDHGFLSDYRLFAPSAPDLSQLHTMAGDYRKDESADLMMKSSITGDAVSHWVQHADNRKTVVYAVSIEHSQMIAASFRDRGIMAFHVDGDTPENIRTQAMRDLADGRLQVVTNCQLFTEGVDLSALAGKPVTIECVVNLRPTKSLALWTQIVGRALRPKERHALILDHAGCALTLGLPDDDVEWELTYDKPSKQTARDADDLPVRVCAKCFAAQRPAPVCRQCGAPFPVKSRKVDERAGQLQELTQEQMAERRVKRHARQEIGMAKTLEELIEIGRMRGYKPGWAQHIFDAKQRKQA